jgi:radical SAM protein with 4Fe4S-binding SPASM domain
MTFETKDEIGKFQDHWEKIVDAVSIGKTQPLEPPKGEYVYYRPCTEVWHKLTVKWDGQVSACCNDSDNMLVVGAIKQNSLYNIWNNNQVLDAIRKLLINNKFRTLSLCKNCTDLDGGFCVFVDHCQVHACALSVGSFDTHIVYTDTAEKASEHLRIFLYTLLLILYNIGGSMSRRV